MHILSVLTNHNFIDDYIAHTGGIPGVQQRSYYDNVYECLCSPSHIGNAQQSPVYQDVVWTYLVQSIILDPFSQLYRSMISYADYAGSSQRLANVMAYFCDILGIQPNATPNDDEFTFSPIAVSGNSISIVLGLMFKYIANTNALGLDTQGMYRFDDFMISTLSGHDVNITKFRHPDEPLVLKSLSGNLKQVLAIIIKFRNNTIMRDPIPMSDEVSLSPIDMALGILGEEYFLSSNIHDAEAYSDSRPEDDIPGLVASLMRWFNQLAAPGFIKAYNMGISGQEIDDILDTWTTINSNIVSAQNWQPSMFKYDTRYSPTVRSSGESGHNVVNWANSILGSKVLEGPVPPFIVVEVERSRASKDLRVTILHRSNELYDLEPDGSYVYIDVFKLLKKHSATERLSYGDRYSIVAYAMTKLIMDPYSVKTSVLFTINTINMLDGLGLIDQFNHNIVEFNENNLFMLPSYVGTGRTLFGSFNRRSLTNDRLITYSPGLYARGELGSTRNVGDQITVRRADSNFRFHFNNSNILDVEENMFDTLEVVDGEQTYILAQRDNNESSNLTHIYVGGMS